MLSDLKWRLRFLITGKRPFPRTTTTERVKFFKEMMISGMDADEAWQVVADIGARQIQNQPPPWA